MKTASTNDTVIVVQLADFGSGRHAGRANFAIESMCSPDATESSTPTL